MRGTGMFLYAIGHQIGYRFTEVNRLRRKYIQTNSMKDLLKSSRPTLPLNRN